MLQANPAVVALVYAVRVTVIEAKELLGTFDGSLREYAARKLVAQGVKLRKASRDSEWQYGSGPVAAAWVRSSC